MDSDSNITRSVDLLRAGTVVGQYRIDRKIGAGGMGEVYLALDTTLNRKVALKFLPSQLCQDDECRARFRREAQGAARLDHPNIVSVHEVGVFRGCPFFVMQYIEGQSLRDLIRSGRIEIERILAIVEQICSGLEKAHGFGIVHRDIKPTNVLITADGVPKIVDFGLAAVAGEGEITQSGSILGTIGYMSPEQARGERVDARSDIFSLGAVLYEMVTGRRPFRAETAAATIDKILNDDPPPVRESRADAPQALHDVIMKALEKDVNLRYRTVGEMKVALSGLKSVLKSVPGENQHRPSIAVLPFVNLSADPDQEYFCDGMAEEIINALTRLEGLRVVARTSCFAFKGRQEDIRTIGRKLDVETVLEGSVRKAGSRLRITAQLVKVSDGYHLWSERYDREMDDIFAIQDEISLAIIDSLKIRLLEDGRSKVARGRTADPDAYNSYLLGRYFFNLRKPGHVEKAIEHFSAAIRKDPRLALAYTGLADSHLVLARHHVLPPKEAYDRARAAALKALEIDRTLSRAHVSLGNIRLWCDWDWRGSRRSYEEALALNPSDPEAHHMYAHLMQNLGRHDDAFKEITRAIDLDPVSPGLHSCAGEILYFARRYDEAVEQIKRTMEMAPHFFGLYGWLGMARIQNEDHESGIEALTRGINLLANDPRMMAFLGVALAVSGRRDETDDILKRLTGLEDETRVDPYFLGWVHTARGDRAPALEALENAFKRHSVSMMWLKIDPLLDSLRSERRFASLQAKMGLA